MTETGAGAKRPAPARRSDYCFFVPITTRWMDNDAYSHVNNVVYYSFIDTVVNRFLIDNGLLDVARSPVIGLAAESQCRFFSPIAYPDLVHAGLRAGHVGNSSVRYEIGLFRNDEDQAAAEGYFVHVYVDRANGRPVPLPEPMRQALVKLMKS